MPDTCWVLVRDGLVWHLLMQGSRDPRGFYGRPTTCGTVTPSHSLDVLAFSHAQPLYTHVCMRCRINVETSPHGMFDTLCQQIAGAVAVEQTALVLADHDAEDRVAVAEHAFRYDRRRG